MKKFFGYFAAFVLAAGLIGCSDDDADYAGAVDGAQVYFPTSTATTYTLSAETNSVSVAISRVDTNGAIDVPVTLTAADPAYASLFRGASDVIFADGASTAPYTISFDRDALEDGAAYSLALTIDDANLTTPYGASTLNISLRVPEPLVLLGTGLFRDDVVTTFFSVDNVEYEVEIYENTKRPGFIFLKNVYTYLYPYNDPGDYVEEDKYFEINIADPNNVVIPQQGLGMDWGYGEFYVQSIEGGTLKDNVITFPTQGLVVAMLDYNDAGFYYSNGNGLFRVALPGAVLTDYSVEITYAGRFTDPSNNNFAVAEVSGGEDVEYIEIGMAATDNAQAVLNAMLAGQLETVRVEGRSGSAQLPLAEDGTYTLVAVSYGGGEAQEAASTSFKFYAGTAPELSPLDQEYTADDFYGISKQELFKTWIMWAIDPDDEDGITDRQPFTYVSFSESDEDFVDAGELYDMINIEGFGLGITEDDAHLWEYYNGIILNFYMHENIGNWNGYYVNYIPYVGGMGSYSAFYDEIMMGGLVDEGYIAMAFSGFYNLGGNPEPNGFQWNAYVDEACGTSAGYLWRLYNIMFEDPAVSDLFSTRAAGALKAPKASFSKNELNTLAQSLSIRENYVETTRGMAHRKIDELLSAKKTANGAAKGSFEIIGKQPAKSLRADKLSAASAVVR